MSLSRLASLACIGAAAILPSPARAADDLAKDRPAGEVEMVATFDGPMPTGVTVSHSGRIFVNFPTWGDTVDFTVAEVKHGKPVAYPDLALNRAERARRRPPDLGAERRGRPERSPLDPRYRQHRVRPDLARRPEAGRHRPGHEPGLHRRSSFPPDVALPTSYLNDVRFDLRRGEAGFAFLTDSSDKGPNGIIVVDLATGPELATAPRPPDDQGRARDARPGRRPAGDGAAAGRAAEAGDDGHRRHRHRARRFPALLLPAGQPAPLQRERRRPGLRPHLRLPQVAATVLDHGEKRPSDGLESDDQGRLYATNYEHNAVLRRSPDGPFETLVHDLRILGRTRSRLPSDGHLYFTANQLHRQAATTRARTSARSRTSSSGSRSTPGRCG